MLVMSDMYENLYMVRFLTEPVNSDHPVRLALPARRRKEDYETRLQRYVEKEHQPFLHFAKRHGVEIDYPSSSIVESALLLMITDVEVIAALKLTFHGTNIRVIKYNDYLERRRQARAETHHRLQMEEYENVKKRYFELKAILEPDA